MRRNYKSSIYAFLSLLRHVDFMLGINVLKRKLRGLLKEINSACNKSV